MKNSKPNQNERTLVELPCKVGDKVYFIVHGCDGWIPRQDGGIILK